MLISSVPVGQSTCKQCQNSWSQNSTLKIQTIMHNMRKWPECCFFILVIKCDLFHIILTCRPIDLRRYTMRNEDALSVKIVDEFGPFHLT